MANAERYPLHVEEGCDGWIWSKGHHEPAAFLRAVMAATGEDSLDVEGDAYRVKHTWKRHAIHTWDVGDAVYYDDADGPGPGAFPATELW